MKTVTTFLALCIVGLLTAQQQGSSFAEANSSKTANLVYVHAAVNGFAVKDAAGSETGLLVDLMNEFEQYLATNYGINVNSRYVEATDKDFGKYLDEVKASSGGVFGLSNTSIKPERRAIYEFSTAFLNNISVLISHRSFPTLTNMGGIGTSFDGKTGYAVVGTTNHARMIEVKRSGFSSMNISEVNSSKEIVENVARDSNGYGFVDIHYYLDFLNQGAQIKRHPVGDQAGDKFGIIMPKGSDWAPVLSAFVSDFIKTPKYREMVTKNLGKGALRMIVQ